MTEPVARIAPAPWMRAAGTRAILAALDGGRGRTRFVGGCVRDTLASRPVTDIDLATMFAPEEVMARLQRAGVRVVPTGIRHGTVTAVAGETHIEITTLRRDVETDGRHAKVAFTDDWDEDAARRDLTINALSCDAEGRVFDPFGGLADLRAGRVRFVGDALTRIDEDVLRLLRFFRFHAHYGRGAPDAAGLAAARARTTALDRLSGERIRNEILKLLAAPAPHEVVAVMVGAGVLAPLLAQPLDVAALAALVALEARLGDTAPIRRLGALLGRERGSAAGVRTRLRLSRAEGERLAAMLATPWPAPDTDPAAGRRRLYRLGARTVADVVLLAWAHAEAAGGASPTVGVAYAELYAQAQAWKRPRLPVRGADAKALGVAEGPPLGALIAALESWWIAGDFRAGRAACLEKLAQLARDPRD